MPDLQTIIGHSAQIDPSVTIGPFSVIEGGVEIDANVVIHSNVRINTGTKLASGCQIFHGAVLGERPQVMQKPESTSNLTVGCETVIREYVTINRGSAPSSGTSVGDRCFIMSYAHIGHDCSLGDGVVLANSVALAGHVSVGNHVGIGGLVPVHQFSRIGDHAFIGGGYRVSKDVPPFVLAAGEPLRYCGLNRVGLRRKGFSTERINPIDRAYRLIYRSGLNISQATRRIHDEMAITEDIEQILRFIDQSERGLIRK